MKISINKAKKTLLGNRRRGYTLPTNNKLYPAQWNWDSGFIALGYSYFNLNFALREINTLLDGQWRDGMVPHILFHNTKTNYYPNYTAWNCGNKIHSSGITQPPILATILKEILSKNKINKTQLLNIKKIIKKIKKFHEWFIQFRDPKKTGLVSILHPWESGYDNSPLWDDPMNKVKIEKNIKYKRADNKVVNPDFRPLDIDYDRYVTIKNNLRKLKYNPKKVYKSSLFNVVDVGFNSIFLKANKDLVELLDTFGLNKKKIDNYIKVTEKNFLKLYDKKRKTFFSKDIKNNKKIYIPSITNYFLLFADLNNDKINKRLIQNLKKHNLKEKYFFSSIKSNHKSFEEKRYWRGPVWINCNWFIYKGLKNKDRLFSDKIKNKTIQILEKKGFFEYFSCKSGQPMGAKNFSWSAALYLDLKLNKN
jgi:glycogen debranching enzyme